MSEGLVDAPALELRNLSKVFQLRRSGMFGRDAEDFLAVNDVNLTVERNSVVALVGESGSGKTTTGMLALRLLDTSGGQILLNGTDITSLSPAELKPHRKDMQVVFQDSYSALDPMMTLGEIVAEPLDIHQIGTPSERKQKAAEWLGRVGLDGSYTSRYPHELSGGQRQRVAIARSLILGASVLVADEPTSALDVSVKAQIVNLMQDLQAEMGLSILFISHDLSVVRSLADKVVVMFRGRVVEMAPTEAIFEDARHPYTQSLLDAVPVIDPRARRRRMFLSADELDARTPLVRAASLKSGARSSDGKPHLVEVVDKHFVEAIIED